MARQSIDIEVNKELASVAGFVCAVGFGFAAFVFEFANPLIAGGIAAVLGYGVTYPNKKYGTAAICVGVIAFLIALTN